MKTYTLIAGVNGVGKSGLTGVLKEDRSDLGHIVDFDRIMAENGYNIKNTVITAKERGYNIEKTDVIRRFGKRFDELMKILPYCDETH